VDSKKAQSRLQRLTDRAEHLIAQPKLLMARLSQARMKVIHSNRRELNQVRSELTLLIDFALDLTRGEYQAVNVKTPVMIIAAILYFLMPLDSIPDFLLGFGYLDDVTIITFVFNQLREEMTKYKAWRNQRGDHGDEAP
jgi:uncharacterized membrane protein YkvA (DUF1232 family)